MALAVTLCDRVETGEHRATVVNWKATLWSFSKCISNNRSMCSEKGEKPRERRVLINRENMLSQKFQKKNSESGIDDPQQHGGQTHASTCRSQS